MTEARTVAEKVLTQHEKAFELVTRRLVEKETIEREEYESIIVAQGIPLKKKEIEL
jgi:ATP-dependent Zn protease